VVIPARVRYPFKGSTEHNSTEHVTPMTRATILALVLLLATAGCDSKTPVAEISLKESGVVVADSQPSDVELPWAQWRGGSKQGVVSDAQIPETWSDSQNVRWQADVPGRAHSSPIVVGDLVVLGTATEQPQEQSVMAFNRSSGDEVWRTVIHSGGFPSESELHLKSTHANGTLASDGTALVTAHLNGNHIWVTALGLDGKQLWQTDIGAFNSKFGYALLGWAGSQIRDHRMATISW